MRYSSRRHVEVARSQSNADANITCGCMLILLNRRPVTGASRRNLSPATSPSSPSTGDNPAQRKLA